MDFDEYQNAASATSQGAISDHNQDFTVSLLGLAGEAGELISEYKKNLRDGQSYIPIKERVSEELGDVLWYVASIARNFDLSLSEVAQNNLKKIEDRWGDKNYQYPHFDEGFSSMERLPRHFRVNFKEVIVDGKRASQMIIDNIELGNSLTDNAYDEDGYRFHDVFHWACAAIIGWSPVLRKLLRVKRKSNVKIDEVEDGARAAAIEEGISAMVFSYAFDRRYLEGVQRVDSMLLRMIKGMTRNLEVNVVSSGAWEKVILATFEVWRYLNENDGGVVEVDLNQRKIKVCQ